MIAILQYLFEHLSRRRKDHNMAVFRKIGVLYISRCFDLVKITTNYWFWIEIVGGEMGLKCKNTESEVFFTLLSVLYRRL